MRNSEFSVVGLRSLAISRMSYGLYVGGREAVGHHIATLAEVEPARAAEVAAVFEVTATQGEGFVVGGVFALHHGVEARSEGLRAHLQKHINAEDVAAVLHEHAVAARGRTDIQVVQLK